jgi:signal transduction histidine kinase
MVLAMHESSATAPRLSTTMVMSIAALGAALIAIFGDKQSFSWVTVAFALAGLLPWALEAGGVRVRPWLFFAMTMVPAAGIVLIDRNPGGMFPAMLAVVWLTRVACGPAMTVVPVATAVAITVGLALLEGTTHETGTIYFAGGAGVAFLAGSMIRRQDHLLAELQEARAREAFHAAADERTRIARDIHDVVAHSLTVTMLHVTGARRAISHDPARAAEALERAETVGRESLDSIRRVVGLLRSSADGGPGESPLPTVDDIPALVAQFREAGLLIDAELDLDDVGADATTSLTAYRVVQEALSNALQHAPGAPMTLRVVRDGAGTVLRIVAENPTGAGAPAGAASPRGAEARTGLGLRGMGERVRAAGGSVEAGLVDRGRWRVEAALPLRRLAPLS